MAIFFHTEDIKFDIKNKRDYKNWIKEVIEKHNKKLSEVNYIFVSDERILEINKEYLAHDYYTDIITFDYCEDNIVSGDLFISIDTIRTNSEKFKTDFLHELNRVIIHGILHLIGFKDKTEREAEEMRRKEDESLNLIKF